MVTANRHLLRDVRRMAIRAEAAAMRLRGRLVPLRPRPSGSHRAAPGPRPDQG
jgi:hypothetical protein